MLSHVNLRGSRVSIIISMLVSGNQGPEIYIYVISRNSISRPVTSRNVLSHVRKPRPRDIYICYLT